MAEDRWTFDPGPDPRAVAYLQAKGLERSWRWPSVWRQEHAFAFTLAGVHRLDVIAAAKELTTQAVAKGETFEAFQRQFEERLKAAGFSGPQVVTEFEEGPRKVNLSAPARVRVIYDTNVRQAYAAAEWQAIEDTAADFPALMYKHTDQANPRLEHKRFDGIVLPVTHAFWRTHYPQNGWFCKCWTLQVSVDELASGAVALTSPERLAAAGYVADREQWPLWRHKATGQEDRVPEGVDPAFAYNAGMARRANLGNLLERRVEALDPNLARAASADLVNFPVFADMVEDAVALGQARAAAATSAARQLLRLGAGKPEVDAAREAAADIAGRFPSESWPVGLAPEIEGVASSIVVANARGIGHSANFHPTRPADWRKVQALLERGETWRNASGELTILGAFAGEADAEPQTWLLAIKRVDGAWRVKTLFPTSPRKRATIAKRHELVRPGSGVIELLR